MKKILLLIIVAMSFVSGYSQIQRKVIKDTAAAGEKKVKDSKKKQFEELNLSKEQRGKLKEMRQANKAGKDAIMNDDALTDEQKKAKVDSLKKGNAVKLQGVLTDEQKQKLREMRKQKKG